MNDVTLYVFRNFWFSSKNCFIISADSFWNWSSCLWLITDNQQPPIIIFRTISWLLTITRFAASWNLLIKFIFISIFFANDSKTTWPILWLQPVSGVYKAYNTNFMTYSFVSVTFLSSVIRGLVVSRWYQTFVILTWRFDCSVKWHTIVPLYFHNHGVWSYPIRMIAITSRCFMIALPKILYWYLQIPPNHTALEAIILELFALRFRDGQKKSQCSPLNTWNKISDCEIPHFYKPW